MSARRLRLVRAGAGCFGVLSPRTGALPAGGWPGYGATGCPACASGCTPAAASGCAPGERGAGAGPDHRRRVVRRPAVQHVSRQRRRVPHRRCLDSRRAGGLVVDRRNGHGHDGQAEVIRVLRSCATKAPASSGRAAGSLSVALSTSSSTRGAMSFARVEGAGTRCAHAGRRRSSPSPRVKGGLPVSSSKSTTPAEYTSERWSARPVPICSGGQYATVPIISPVRVEAASASTARASPKSATFTTPSSESRMFSGLTSRCTRPARCAAARALSTGSMIETRLGRREPARARATGRAACGPRTSSMTRNTWCPAESIVPWS